MYSKKFRLAAILLIVAAGFAAACMASNKPTYYPPASVLGPYDKVCHAIYDQMYIGCGLSFEDNNSVAFPEERVLTACAQNQAGYGPDGAFAQCIDDNAGNCDAMANCLAEALKGV
jgi:hypothetical protein